MPNTYYSVTDDYVIGLRWYDRGNYAKAAYYWDPLVEKGDCDAEFRVGFLYFLGQGKPQDNEQALALWRKAANGNQQKAQWALGDLYYQNISVIKNLGGHGCPKCEIQKDIVQAYVWYRLFEKSAKYGNEKSYAKQVLAEITSEMNSDQINQGDELVLKWIPTPKDCGARNLW
jgi:TPR repeat protein